MSLLAPTPGQMALARMIAQGSTPEGAADILNADIRRWAEVIARAKIEKQ